MVSSNVRNAVGAVVIICVVCGIYMVNSPHPVSRVTTGTIESVLYTEDYSEGTQPETKGSHLQIVDKIGMREKNKATPKSDNHTNENDQENSETAADVTVSVSSSSTTITLPVIVSQPAGKSKNSSQELMAYDERVTEEPTQKLTHFIMDFEASEDIAAVLAARRAHVYKTCELHKPEIENSISLNAKSYFYLKTKNRNVITDYHEKLTFCTVAKSGSTFWKSVFIYLNTGAIKNGMTAPQHLSKHSRRSLGSWSKSKTREAEYTSFVAVRNPWKRLVSLYQQKIEGFLPRLQANNFTSIRQMAPYKYMLKVCHTKPWQLVTFADMLKCVLAHDVMHQPNRHWETAYEYCDICNSDYSYIIRTENMMEEGAYVMKQAGLRNADNILNTVRSGTIRDVEKRKSKSYSDYYTDVDEETIKKLKSIYEWEFKLFNYPDTPFTT